MSTAAAARPGEGRRRAQLCAAVLAAALGLPAGAGTQELPRPRAAVMAAPDGFIEITPTEGRAPVHLAVAQVVRVGRAEGHTVIDTTAWVQQRTVEPAESVARRLRAAGQRLVPLTDLRSSRIWLAVDRVVLVRDSQERHAAGARAAIVMMGLRFSPDVAVRETAEEVMAALRREASAVATGNGRPETPATGPVRPSARD
jgi:hypothetical protein